MARLSVFVTCGFLILAVFVAGGQGVCDGPGAAACYSTLATAMETGNKEQICEALADPEAMKTCVKNKIADCGAEKQNFQGQFDTKFMPGAAMCSPGCENLMDSVAKIQDCGLTFSQKFAQAAADKNEDVEQMCSAYHTFVGCLKDALGSCKVMQDKLDEQISQYASIMDDKCPSLGTAHGPTSASVGPSLPIH